MDSLDRSEIRDFFNRRIYDRGKELYRAGAVLGLRYDPEAKRLEAVVVEQSGRFETLIQADQEDDLLAWCNCDQLIDGQCPHMVALLLAWTEPGKDSPQEVQPAAYSPIELFDFPESPSQPGQPVLKPGASLFTEGNFDPVADYRRCLEPLTIKNMRALAGQRGVAAAGVRRDPLLAGLAEALAQPENIWAAVQKLSPEARLALDLAAILLPQGQGASYVSFLQLLERVFEHLKHRREAGVALDELADLGLLILDEHYIHLPASVSLSLPTNPQLAAGLAAQPPAGARLEPARPLELPRLAVRLLLLAQAGEMKRRPPGPRSRWGDWPEASAEDGALNDVLSGASTKAVAFPQPAYLEKGTLDRLARDTGQPAEKLDYLARLLETAGLWKPGKGGSLGLQAEAFTQFLSLPPQEQARRLARAALSLADWSEFDLVIRKHGLVLARRPYAGSMYAMFLSQRAFYRSVLLHFLALIPAGTWIGMDLLLGWLHLLGLDYQYPYAEQNLWLEQKGRRVDPQDFEQWSATYGQFYQVLLSGPAHWLGLCDLAWEGGRLAAYRLTTPLGAFLFGQQDHFELPQPGQRQASIRPAGEMKLELDLDQAGPAILGLLPLMGDLQPAGSPGRRGALVYQLTAAGALRVFQQGWTLEAVLATLAAAASGRESAPAEEALSEQLRQRITGWWESYGRLHIYTEMALVEFADDFALNELLASTRLSRHLLYVFSPRLVAVNPQGVADLLLNLEASGYTPTLESSGGGSAPGRARGARR